MRERGGEVGSNLGRWRREWRWRLGAFLLVEHGVENDIFLAQWCLSCIFLSLILQAFLPGFSRWVCCSCGGGTRACDSKADTWVSSSSSRVQTRTGSRFVGAGWVLRSSFMHPLPTLRGRLDHLVVGTAS